MGKRFPKTVTRALVAAICVVLGGSAAITACDDSTPSEQVTPKPSPQADGGPPVTVDAEAVDSAVGFDDAGKPVDCFPDPKTHLEIINRCSDSVKIDKKPVLPLLLADGGLPPLPQ